PPSAFRADLDPALEAVLLKAMAHRPEERYASAGQFLEALNDWLGNPRALGNEGPPAAVPVAIPVAVPVALPASAPVPSQFAADSRAFLQSETAAARQPLPVGNAAPLPELFPSFVQPAEETWLGFKTVMMAAAALLLLGGSTLVVLWAVSGVGKEPPQER